MFEGTTPQRRSAVSEPEATPLRRVGLCTEASGSLVGVFDIPTSYEQRPTSSMLFSEYV